VKLNSLKNYIIGASPKELVISTKLEKNYIFLLKYFNINYCIWWMIKFKTGD